MSEDLRQKAREAAARRLAMEKATPKAAAAEGNFQDRADAMTADQVAVEIRKPGAFGDWLRGRAAASREKMTTGPALAAGLSDALSMGTADEIAAGLSGEPVQKVRQAQSEMMQANPGVSGAGQFLGTAAAGVLPVGGALQASRGAGLLTRMTATGAAGAGMGALETFNRGEGGALNRLQGIADNPAPVYVGGGVGAAVPAVGAGVGSVAAALMKRKAPALAREGIQSGAAKPILRAFEADSASGADIQDYLKDLGPEAMLLDGGRNLRGQGSAMAQLPGAQQNEMVRALERRQAGRANRVESGLNQALGDPIDMTALLDAKTNQRRATARAAYDAFAQQEIPLTDGLRRDLARLATQPALMREARNIALLRGFTFDPEQALSPDAVAISGEVLDIITRAARDKANAAFRQGMGTGAAVELDNLTQRILDEAPDLRSIRRQYAHDSAVMEAMEAGGDLLNPRVSADRFRRQWAEMSPEEQDAFRNSARDAIDQRLANATNEDLKSTTFLTRAVREKMGVAFGDGAADRLARLVDSESVMNRSANRIINNSETAANQAAMREFGPMVDEAGNRYGPVGRGKQALADAGNTVLDALTRTKPGPVMQQTARTLTAQGPARDRIVQALIADAARRRAKDGTAKSIEEITNYLLSAGVNPVRQAVSQ